MKNMTGLLIALMLLVPTLASAGLIYSSTPTTSPVRGTISPKGYVSSPNDGSTTFTVKANPGYMISSVALNGNPLSPSGSTPDGGATYVVPNSPSSQKILASFLAAVPTKLEAKIAGPLSVNPDAALTISGGTSTVVLPAGVVATYTWSVSPSGPTLTPASGSTTNNAFSTSFKYATPGVFTVTLKLSAPGMSDSTASTTVTVVKAVDAQNKACTDCHGSQNAAYHASAHYANYADPISCASCHVPGQSHPGPVTPKTVSALTWKALVAAGPAKAGEYFCLGTAITGCHSPANIWDRDLSKSSHFQGPNNSLCTSCHYNDGTGNTTIHNPAYTFAQGCGKCHAAPAEFEASPHGSNPYNEFSGECRTCHTGNVTLPSGEVARQSKHRPETFKYTNGNVCINCHKDPYFPNNIPGHLNIAATHLCTDCHNPHTTDPSKFVNVQWPHYNNVTDYSDPAYTANYVTPRTTCANCHGNPDSAEADQIRAEWAASGKGDVTSPALKNSASHDWKNSGNNPTGTLKAAQTNSQCTRCHTTVGFLNFSTYKVFSYANYTDKKSEPLTCNACHNADFSVRSLAAYPAQYYYSSAARGTANFQYPDVGKSNVCVSCHANRQIGQNITNVASRAPSSYWKNASMLSPHYMGAAGTTFGANGYLFLTSNNYTETVNHTLLGTTNGSTDGPCVACHMNNDSHTFEADLAVCVQCHGSSMSADKVAQYEAEFTGAKRALQAQISASRGARYYSGSFYTSTARTTTYTNWSAAGYYGAGFNLRLFDISDSGAFVHRPAYTKQLLRDSLEYVKYRATYRSSTTSTPGALQALVDSGALSQTDASNANSFLATGETNVGTGCTTCHGNPMPDPVWGANILTTFNSHESATCNTCHNPGGGVVNHPLDPTTMRPGWANLACSTGSCHGEHDQSDAVLASAHATSPAAAPYFEHGCDTCHNVHRLGSSSFSGMITNCYDCHRNSTPFVWQGYSASTHRQPPIGSSVGCDNCHTDSHSLVMRTLYKTTGTIVRTNSTLAGLCQSCHYKGNSSYPPVTDVYGGIQGIYSSYYGFAPGTTTGTRNWYLTDTMYPPHGGGKATPSTGAVNTGDAITQYVTQGAICQDCHGHNNTIEAGYAESGHGKVSSDPMNAFTHYDWSLRTNDGTRGNSNCDRCHTTYGFLKFANQTTSMTRLQLKSGQPNNVMLCITCHKSADGDMRNNIVTKDGGIVLANGYKGKYTGGSPSITVEIQFNNYDNSNICIPCHSGRTTEAIVKQVFFNATTAQTSFYQHAANPVQTFAGLGGYNYTGNPSSPSAHANVKAGTQGPCVGCHNSAAGKTHSLEAIGYDTTCVAASCHPSGFGASNVSTAKANYDAAVAILQALVHLRLDPLRVNQSLDISTERAWVRFGAGTNSPAVASMNGGLWYNWQILVNADEAAYVHNPYYSRKLLLETIDYADDGVINGSAPATILNGTSLPGITSDMVSKALAFISGP